MADETNTPNEVVAAEDGRIERIDGLLKQVADAGAQAVREQIWPEFKSDPTMQVNIGVGIGRGAGQELKPWVALGATALAVTAGVLLYKAIKPDAPRANPRGRR